MNDLFRMNCWFEGRVQGVGFRFRTTRISNEFKVTGTVRNLADGRVHLYVEGEESEVRAFQQAVALKLKDYIRAATIEFDRGPRTCNSFDIIQ